MSLDSDTWIPFRRSWISAIPQRSGFGTEERAVMDPQLAELAGSEETIGVFRSRDRGSL
jgi:hypothetical protein